MRITAPPVVFRDLVITGLAFHTVPRPGEAGHDTWAGDPWKDRMRS